MHAFRIWRTSLVLTGMVLLGAALPAAWATPIVTFDPATGGNGTHNNQSVGWQFDVLTSLTVTGLSWYDDGANGLAMSHTVGIWNPSGTLMASILVPAGTAAPLDGQFRTVGIAPLTLTVGSGYIVGGEDFANNTERLAFDVTQTVDPRIRYVDATFTAVGAGFSRPTNFSVANTGFYGPSFAVAGTTIPEAGTGALLAAAGVLSGAGLAWRRRKA